MTPKTVGAPARGFARLFRRSLFSLALLIGLAANDAAAVNESGSGGSAAASPGVPTES